ncbi:inhibitor of trypsin and hageman factor-like [Apium graveolens]|uniref:inhibitor of trypsin and hageman factor-like n=1 Tax=Apium graveolens TaxID=4045 RepID=UPI003D7BE571
MSSRSCSAGKSSWSELNGINGELAAQIIERENQSVNAVVVSENTFGTTEFNCFRVRVKVDSNGIVTSTPRIG